MDRDLIEKLLTAQILTLAAVMREESARKGSQGSDKISDAIREIKRRQPELIQKLLESPPAEGSGPQPGGHP